MLSLIDLIASIAVCVLMAALMVGVFGGLATMLWRWAKAIRKVSHAFVLHAGGWVLVALEEGITIRLPWIMGACETPLTRPDLIAEIARLEHALAAAHERLARVTKALGRLRRELNAGNAQDAELFASVGLHPSCEDFLVRAARVAYRKEFHPDVCRVASAAEATRRFQEAENTFDAIGRIRATR